MITRIREISFAFFILVGASSAFAYEEIIEGNDETQVQNFLEQGLAQFLNLAAAETSPQIIQLLQWRSTPEDLPLPHELYNRKLHFGRWINDPEDSTCFNTRAKVLVRDSSEPVRFREANKCSVLQGTWEDPYTKKTFNNASEIQIDHLVPLKNAFLAGAWKWDFRTRCLYANYLGEKFHLISTDGIQNMSKGDRGPEAYLPPNEGYTCTYLRSWLAVKLIWKLKMRESEAVGVREALREANCDTQSFEFSSAELREQRNFMVQNVDLCEHLNR